MFNILSADVFSTWNIFWTALSPFLLWSYTHKMYKVRHYVPLCTLFCIHRWVKQVEWSELNEVMGTKNLQSGPETSLYMCGPGETEAFIPTEFIIAGFGDTSCLGNCTETDILASENFDVNNITFSQYRNHTAGKTAVWITPLGSLLQCRDSYLGTISDNDITKHCGVLDMVRRGIVVLTDKGFGITETCLQKGLHHNQPPLKLMLSMTSLISLITLRIYSENYIGRMRDWATINACWSSSRIDPLGDVHKLLNQRRQKVKQMISCQLSKLLSLKFCLLNHAIFMLLMRYKPG